MSKKERGGEKFRINILMVGPVSSGKSTTGGQLIYKCAGIGKETVEKYERDTLEAGKEGIQFAWILDRLKIECKRGPYMSFSTEKYYVTLIDEPGHSDFTENLIGSITQADCAVLVVSANEEDVYLEVSEGNTQQDILLCYALGIQQMIVCVNKMDTTSWSKSRFDEISEKIKTYLKQAGYKPEAVAFIPVSGLNNDNIIDISENSDWFEGWSTERKGVTAQGKTLLEAIDAISRPERPKDLPLRIPISKICDIGGIGTIAIGRVETGSLKVGDEICFTPGNIIDTCAGIESDYRERESAVPGDIIDINVKGIPFTDLEKGMVLGQCNNDLPRECDFFIAQVIILNHPDEITNGYTCIVDCHTCHVPCRFETILSKIDRRTGKELGELPESLKKGESALVKMVPEKPMVVETFENYQPLGRIVIRDSNTVVGMGLIKDAGREEAC